MSNRLAFADWLNRIDAYIGYDERRSAGTLAQWRCCYEGDISARAARFEALNSRYVPMATSDQSCHADQDNECGWIDCPRIAGGHCPLWQEER